MVSEPKGLEDIRREEQEASRLLKAKREELRDLYNAVKMVDGLPRPDPHQLEVQRKLEGDATALNDKVNTLQFQFMALKNAADMDRQGGSYRPAPSFSGNGGGNGNGSEAMKDEGRQWATLGEAFINSDSYRKWLHGSQNQSAHTDVSSLSVKSYAFEAARAEAMKATLTTSGMTSIEKFPAVIQLGQQMLTVADLFANAETNNTTVRYLQERTFTNSSAFIAENAQKPEATWDLVEVDSPVKKVGWVSRTTTEMYEDYPATRDYINQRMPFGVRQTEEFQLLNGSGGNSLSGLLGTSGILTQARGTANNIDAIYLGITKVRTQGFWEPDAIVIDPTNWNAIRLYKTTIGSYEYGPPSQEGPETLFGKRVVITANMGLSAANTAIVGAWKLGGTVFYRHGIRIEATNSDQNDFIFNRVAIRAEQREALAVWRPKAFCTVTGLDV